MGGWDNDGANRANEGGRRTPPTSHKRPSPPLPRARAVVKVVERILYAADSEEAKAAMADVVGALPAEPLAAGGEGEGVFA